MKNFEIILQSSKMIGSGLATSGLIGAGVGIVFGSFVLFFSLFVNRLLSLKKKIIILFCLVFYSFIFVDIDTAELNKHLVKYSQYFIKKQVRRNYSIRAAELYFFLLTHQLFEEKRVSPLVVKILLWYNASEEDLKIYFYFINTLVFMNSSFLMYSRFELQIFAVLNLYRLGFMEPSSIRYIIWKGVQDGKIQIQEEAGFKQYLEQSLAKYSALFPVDEQDKVCFDQLINWEWTSLDMSSFKF